ncbi:MAG: hypothetical protein LBT50_08250 [Prevotellaceae bacterium]|nr:hypothetical protein [Prevotellaceae bacterium]
MTDKDGNNQSVNAPVVSELPDNVLQVEFSTASGQVFTIVFLRRPFRASLRKSSFEMDDGTTDKAIA